MRSRDKLTCDLAARAQIYSDRRPRREQNVETNPLWSRMSLIFPAAQFYGVDVRRHPRPGPRPDPRITMLDATARRDQQKGMAVMRKTMLSVLPALLASAFGLTSAMAQDPVKVAP